MSVKKSSQTVRQQLIVKYERELIEFEDWIKTKPHLPQNMGNFCDQSMKRVLSFTDVLSFR